MANGAEKPKESPKDAAKKAMAEYDVQGLMTAKEQRQQEGHTWVEVGNKRFDFHAETRHESEQMQQEFIKLVRKGMKPKEAYAKVTGAEKPVKLEKMKAPKLKKALALISKFSGAKLAKLLGYADCQDAVDRGSVADFVKMGFEEYQAKNAMTVLLDGRLEHTWSDGNGTRVVSQEYRRQREPLHLVSKEEYERSQMSDAELAELKAKESESASAQAAADLF